ncbi:MAG: tRNA (N(6)-L-threonylcarbamoyladenosine(37)-C(2))-methylthiotransferase MtaB [Candidatus Thiodiazotropha taylori]|nr:tRNA (N(6)-L-threonylcarbamoyladenosine(37)-C(2))-methylthiotransferase MtaB [Candidatus Thiodiazotropha taylori]MCG8106552.1 tRNA (N(6)-L-threonylcarbamoyladenosine(37)-C(2))-methylthiotransferase MtaB [Candidatus Thiodiazotropha taylori]MCG8110273.1 tRNA (N(6)-L-threonylcarbamoyladenosine(37)-C(2))-methylthiotransferase MtaB [Candidatus Thiodiazotropha taylori]MCW4278889.1 tRNA (N(6)-L-threonylcarbamoyladenosine(37)-C(2))-methylthiotransferase MtaB [Candidatus Thiodiazotropha taylori]MCW42
MRIHLKTLGCRLNEAELETWSREFQARGFHITGQAEEADLLVVNTCAVTQEAVRKSRKLMSRSGRLNPNARLVVSGCYASLEPDQAMKMEGVDLLVDNRDKARLVEIVSDKLDLKLMPEAAMEAEAAGILARGRQRAFIKVQDGCRYRCTFCIVTLARGEERSRPIEEIVDEINRLHGEGIQEVVITGVHIGGYGADIDTNLVQLIEAILADSEIPRLRIGSIEPWDLQTGFWELFENPRLMPHLHLPLQSGADSVLRRMARRCRSDEYRSLITQARQSVEDFNVTTDIIVGFPGESEAEWQQTLDFVEEIGFGHLHIFAYSPRQGTKAAGLPDPVSRDIKRQRSEALHQLGERMKRQTLEAYLGQTLPILVEGSAERGFGGYTPNYLRVEISSSADNELVNRIVPVKLTAITEDGSALIGTVEPI